MTETMQIRESESGLVRLFTLDLPPDQAKDLAEGREMGADAAAAQLKDMLGATHLDIAQVEVFPIGNLEGLGLAAYLEQDEDTLIPDLLTLYPYQSESYDWAMAFGV